MQKAASVANLLVLIFSTSLCYFVPVLRVWLVSREKLFHSTLLTGVNSQLASCAVLQSRDQPLLLAQLHTIFGLYQQPSGTAWTPIDRGIDMLLDKFLRDSYFPLDAFGFFKVPFDSIAR